MNYMLEFQLTINYLAPYLDKTSLEQHLDHFLEYGQNSTMVNTDTPLQHILHLDHLLDSNILGLNNQ